MKNTTVVRDEGNTYTTRHSKYTRSTNILPECHKFNQIVNQLPASPLGLDENLAPAMICLERLGGRALSLPFDLIPSLEMSKTMIGNMVTGALILGPYTSIY